MANKIILKRSSVAAKVPLATDLEVGELAVNLADAKLYSKNASGTVISLGSSSGGASVTVSTTAPSSPTAGDLWWNSEEGKLKIYYNDGNTSQWVDAYTANVGAGSGSADISAAYPIGSIYMSVVSTNPATLFGFGTWASFGAGRMLVGIDPSDADFDTVEETGGAKTSSAVVNHTHTVTVTDPGHTHVQSVNSGTTGALSGYGVDTSTSTSATSGYSTQSNTTGITATTANPAGGVSSFSIMNPYITVYMWKRTA